MGAGRSPAPRRHQLGDLARQRRDHRDAAASRPGPASAEQALVLLKNDAVGDRALLPLSGAEAPGVQGRGRRLLRPPGADLHRRLLQHPGRRRRREQHRRLHRDQAAPSLARDPQARVDFLPGVTGGTSADELTTVDAATLSAVKDYDAVVVVAGTDGSTASEDHDRTHDGAARGAGLDDQPGRGRQPPHGGLPADRRLGRRPQLRGHQPGHPVELLPRSAPGAGHRRRPAGLRQPQRPPALHLVHRRQPAAGHHRLRHPAQPVGPRAHVHVLHRYAELPLRSRPVATRSFRYSHLKVAQRSGGRLRVRITATARVTNTGDVAGAATPQLYVTTPFAPASAERPTKRLLAFDRVVLAPGRSTRVRLLRPGLPAGLPRRGQRDHAGGPGRPTACSWPTRCPGVRQRTSVRVTGRLGNALTTVSVRPVQAGDAAADVAQRVAFDAGVHDRPAGHRGHRRPGPARLHQQGAQHRLPAGVRVRYRSNHPRRGRRAAAADVPCARSGSGIATVTVRATYRRQQRHHVVRGQRRPVADHLGSRRRTSPRARRAARR